MRSFFTASTRNSTPGSRTAGTVGAYGVCNRAKHPPETPARPTAVTRRTTVIFLIRRLIRLFKQRKRTY
jgi:hypothetical protein